MLQYAYLNSHFQSGLKNLLDDAVLAACRAAQEHLSIDSGIRKIDEIPFDFSRRRMSVVVERRGRQAHSDLQGRGRGGLRRLHAVRDRRRDRAGSTRAISQTPSRRRSRSTPTDSASSRSPTRRCRAAKAAYSIARRARPDAARLHRLSRSAERERARTAIAALAQHGRARSRSSPATTKSSRARSATRSGSTPGEILLGAKIETMSDDGAGRARRPHHRLRQADRRRRRSGSSGAARARAMWSASWATASTTARP